MDNIQKSLYRFLLVVAAIGIVIAMVAGPLSRTALSIGASASALLVCLCLIAYGLYMMPKKR